MADDIWIIKIVDKPGVAKQWELDVDAYRMLIKEGKVWIGSKDGEVLAEYELSTIHSLWVNRI